MLTLDATPSRGAIDNNNDVDGTTSTTTKMNMNMMMIGNDILDIGSRKSCQKKKKNDECCWANIRNPTNMNRFLVPNVPDPASYCTSHFSSVCGTGDENQQMKFKKGTTTLSFVFQGGIIVSVDSRASQGSYVASSSVHKVCVINPWLLGTMAGGAADCQHWNRQLGVYTRLYELRNGKRISVAAASKWLANTLRSYRGYGLSIGTMVVGWDDRGPQLFYVDNEGTRLRGQYFSQGSGSTFAYGVLDNYWKYDLSVEDAISLGRRAIYHATHRDAASGGMNNLYHVTPDGWTFIGGIDVNELHDQFQDEKKIQQQQQQEEEMIAG